MTTNSLAFRLFATAVAWTLLALPIAGAIIYSLYRQEVDRYLLDELESTKLHGEVANNLIADFSIETFYSWAFEQLTFRVLTRYYEEVGKDVLQAFVDGVRSGSVRGCLEVIVSRVVHRLSEISG